MSSRFNERNTQLVKALCVLDPRSSDFLDSTTVKPLLDLTKTELVDAEFTFARQFLQTQIARSNKDKWTTRFTATIFWGSNSNAIGLHCTQTRNKVWGIHGHL
ncbi:hypothetical protein QQF64_018344 [Cirrhinus molitorella]|uniref:Uncharacterized protein n=1 Tax=Cirrhinus molitorella TaxID=172907 RepID=A0ABR3LGA1_9TELE